MALLHKLGFTGICVLLLVYGVSCKGDDSPGDENAGHGGDAAGSGGGGKDTGTGGRGSGGAISSGGSGGGTMHVDAGPPRRPPNPRNDIGPPDGTLCLGDSGDAVTCPMDWQCCLAGQPSGTSLCVDPGTICQNCKSFDCGAVLCDGPEDCPGQLCCLTQTSCKVAGAPCAELGTYVNARCADRCETMGTDQPGDVVCRDPRDCLYSDSLCVARNRAPRISTCE